MNVICNTNFIQVIPVPALAPVIPAVPAVVPILSDRELALIEQITKCSIQQIIPAMITLFGIPIPPVPAAGAAGAAVPPGAPVAPGAPVVPVAPIVPPIYVPAFLASQDTLEMNHKFNGNQRITVGLDRQPCNLLPGTQVRSRNADGTVTYLFVVDRAYQVGQIPQHGLVAENKITIPIGTLYRTATITEVPTFKPNIDVFLPRNCKVILPMGTMYHYCSNPADSSILQNDKEVELC